MSLIPTIYSSTDPGAPQLTGQAGALLSVLRAILVTGYGAAPSNKAGLGWTEEFTAANKAVFRNNPVTGTGSYLRILDDGTPVGGARTAQLLAFEAMTGVDVGSGQAPSSAAQPSGSLWMKSTSLDATSRPWWAIGNERALYLFVGWFNGGVGHAYFAGDAVSDKPGDAFHFTLMGAPELTSFAGDFSAEVSTCFVVRGYGSTLGNTDRGAGGYMLRGANGLASSVRVFNAWPDFPQSGSVASCYGNDGATNQAGFPAYPDPVTNGYRYCDCLIAEAGGTRAIRGRLPGVYGLMHKVPFAELASVPAAPGMPAGAGVLAKTYFAGDYTAGNLHGQVLFLTGVPWE